jgi:dihydrofolate reductase
MYLTRIEKSFAGDTVFPEYDPEEWSEVEKRVHEPDEKNPHRFAFVVLERATEGGFG